MLTVEAIRQVLSSTPAPGGASSASEKKFVFRISGILFLNAHVNHGTIIPEQVSPFIMKELSKLEEFMQTIGQDKMLIQRAIVDTLNEAYRNAFDCLQNPKTVPNIAYKLNALKAAGDRGYALEMFGGTSATATRTRG